MGKILTANAVSVFGSLRVYPYTQICVLRFHLSTVKTMPFQNVRFETPPKAVLSVFSNRFRMDERQKKRVKVSVSKGKCASEEVVKKEVFLNVVKSEDRHHEQNYDN